VLLMWLAGSTLAALLAGLMRPDGPWLLGLVAVMAAQAAVLAGNAARLPRWAIWPGALVCAAVGALGHRGTDAVLYLVLVTALLVTAGRFARLSGDLSAFCLAHDGAGGRAALRTAAPADPVARELARARRDGSRLTVATITVPKARATARRLARIAHELIADLRRTDAVVRAVTDRLLVVLPGGDHDVAMAVIARVLAGRQGEVLVGTATFPEDGPTWEALKDVARERERPWPWMQDEGVGSGAGPMSRNGARHDRRAHPVGSTPP